MAQKLAPQMSRLLAAGALGSGLALATGAALWVLASAVGMTYEIDGSSPIGLRQVLTSLAIAGLMATALALVLDRRKRGNVIFGAACVGIFVISVVSPITLASDVPTAVVLVAHHTMGGLLIAVPLIRHMAPAVR